MSTTDQTVQSSDETKAQAGTQPLRHGETLSALHDGEAHDLELRRLLRDLEGSEYQEHTDAWYRLQLTRSAMGGERPLPAGDFLAGVKAAIDAEPSVDAPVAAPWRRAAGSLAVAASMAAVVVLGGQQLGITGSAWNGDSGGDSGGRVASLPVGVVNTTGAVPVQASLGARGVPTLQPADGTAYRELARQRLRRYSQEHAEHASLNTPQGLVPFARVPVIEP